MLFPVRDTEPGRDPDAFVTPFAAARHPMAGELHRRTRVGREPAGGDRFRRPGLAAAGSDPGLREEVLSGDPHCRDHARPGAMPAGAGR